jgi:hypothetical protein
MRTLMASTARAGEGPTTIIVSIAATQARIKRNRRPPSSTPLDPPPELRRSDIIRAGADASQLYVYFAARAREQATPDASRLSRGRIRKDRKFN